jgi:hypothetical protein
LEYGRGLANYIVERQTGIADANRVAAREVTSLSAAVNELHYAPASERPTAVARAWDHWQRLRAYLPRITHGR